MSAAPRPDRSGRDARATQIAAGAAAAGSLVLLTGVAAGQSRVALGALAASWLFFAGLAAAGVAVSAAIACSRGRWAAPVTPLLEATARFFPAALGILAVLLLAAPAWMPDVAAAGRAEWLGRGVRDLLATALLAAAARVHLRQPRPSPAEAPGPSRAAIVYLVLYVATLSLWAIDLFMGLAQWATSTVLPPFYFMSAFLAALAWGAAAAVWAPIGEGAERVRHDLGKLTFATVVLWGYLLWSAYLPVWYGNLPEETGQLVARWTGGWKLLSVPTLLLVLALPFGLLLSERAKRARWSLGVAAGSVLVGLLANSYLLVLPSLAPSLGTWELALGLGAALGVGGVFVIAAAPGRGPS